MQPKLISAIVCDLVRTENTGKHILIGVYSGNMVFAGLPAIIPLTLYFEISTNVSNSNINFEIKIDLAGKNKPLEVAGAVAVKDEMNASLILNLPGLNITHLGDMRVSIRFEQEEWIEAITKRIVVQPSLLPTT